MRPRFQGPYKDPGAMCVARPGWRQYVGRLRESDASEVSGNLRWMKDADVGHTVCAWRIDEVLEVVDHSRMAGAIAHLNGQQTARFQRAVQPLENAAADAVDANVLQADHGIRDVVASLRA